MDNATLKNFEKRSFKSINTTTAKTDKITKMGSQIFSDSSPKYSSILGKNSEYKSGGESLKPFSINCLKDTTLNIKHGVIEVTTNNVIMEKVLKFRLSDKNLLIVIKDNGKEIEVVKFPENSSGINTN